MKTNNFFIITAADPTAHFSNKFAGRVKNLFTAFAEEASNISVENCGNSLSVNYDSEVNELDETAPYQMAALFEEFVSENAAEVNDEIYEYGEYAEAKAA